MNEVQERPAERQALTVAQQREGSRQKMLADVEAHKGDIQKFLKAFDIDYDFFQGGLRIFLMRQMQTQPEFFGKVTAASFMEALFRCAKDGLVPDGKEAAIGHFGGVATYMPMRDGFVKVLWRTGMIKDMNDNIVTRGEDDQGRFEYQEGDGGFIRHRPSMDRKDTDEIVAAYCVVNLTTGGSIREVVPKVDLEKIRKMSKSPARANWGAQMDRKAAIRRIMGKMPREKNIAQLLAHDDDAYDLTLLEAPTRTAIPTAALFGAKAHVKAKPALEGPAAPEEPAQEPQADETPADEPEANKAVVEAVTAIMHADDLSVLAELQQDAAGIECNDEERAWINETIEVSRSRLMGVILDGDDVPETAADHTAAAKAFAEENGVDERFVVRLDATYESSELPPLPAHEVASVHPADAPDFTYDAKYHAMTGETVFHVGELGTFGTPHARPTEDKVKATGEVDGVSHDFNPATYSSSGELGATENGKVTSVSVGNSGHTYVSPPPLRVKLSSSQGVRDYADADAWRDAILIKLASIKGDAAEQFWKVNSGYVDDALAAGVTQAERILEVAQGRGLT